MFIGTIKALDLAAVTSNLPEDDAPAYAAGATYNIADEVIYDHVVYGCLVDGTIGKRPDLHANRYQTPQYWQVKGPTNAYAALDGVIATPTVNTAGEVIITVEGFANIAGVAILKAFGTSATAEFFDGTDALIDTQSVNLTGFNQNSYYEWLFTQPTSGSTNHIFREFPVGAVKVRITIAGTFTHLGELAIIETGYNIGRARFGTRIRAASKSIYEDDEFGVPRFVRRPSRVNATFDIHGERVFIDTLWGQLLELSGSRAVYEGVRGRTVTIGAGIVRDIELPIELPNDYLFPIEFEGLL